jgi:flagellar biogenesis protein FliO
LPLRAESPTASDAIAPAQDTQAVESVSTGAVARAGDIQVQGVATGAPPRSFLDDGGGDTPEAAAARVAHSGAQLRGGVWRSLGATLLVIGMLFAANHWIRRRGHGLVSVGRSGRLCIADRVSIDPRRCIMIVEADGERIVVAVGADRIETLAVLPRDAEAEAAEEDA